MDETENTRRPEAPKAVHLPAHDRPCELPEEKGSAPDLMAAGVEKVAPAPWVLRICGHPLRLRSVAGIVAGNIEQGAAGWVGPGGIGDA